MMLDNNCAISVIIPIYNVEKYLLRCLSSVSEQSLKNIEIICINDGSKDNSQDIIQQMADKDPRFKIITQKNRGLSATRNKGMDIAKGEYIFFLDADDYLHKQALEIFYNTAKKANTDIVIAKSFCRLGKEKENKVSYDTNKINYTICKNPLNDLYKHRFVSAVAWNKLFKRDTLKDFRFIEGIYFEDWPFTSCVFSNIDKFALIHEKLYMYNTSSPSIVRSSFSIKKIHDYIFGIRFVYNYFMQQNKFAQWEIVRKKRITSSLKMILSKISKSKENKPELEQYFKREYINLRNEKIVFFKDLSIKSKLRLIYLLWKQRHK